MFGLFNGLSEILAPRPEPLEELMLLIRSEQLEEACAYIERHSEIFEDDSSSGIDINALDLKTGMNVLHMAAAVGAVEVLVELLSRAHADVGAKSSTSGYEGNRALHFAALKNRRNIIVILLRYGADSSQPNDAGLIPYEVVQVPAYNHKDYYTCMKIRNLLIEDGERKDKSKGGRGAYIHAQGQILSPIELVRQAQREAVAVRTNIAPIVGESMGTTDNTDTCTGTGGVGADLLELALGQTNEPTPDADASATHTDATDAGNKQEKEKKNEQMHDKQMHDEHHFKKSALLLIDLQQDYISKGDLLQGQTSPILSIFPDLPRNVETLLYDCRAKKNTVNEISIIHIRSSDSTDSNISKWVPWWNRLHGVGAGQGKANPAEPWAQEVNGEPVFIKHTYDVFMSDEVSTALLEHLHALGIQRLFMCGCLTKACVGFSANSAFTLGFEVFVVADCCADRNKEHHDAYLSMYDGYHIRVIRREDVTTSFNRH